MVEETPTAAAAEQEPGSPAAVAGRWQGAGKKVLVGVRLSNGLTTLRDQLGSDVYVDWTHLKTVKQLGQGAFATVTLCQLSLDGGGAKTVAKKQIRTELLSDPNEVETFVREVKLLRKLNNKHIVGFYGCGWSKESEEQGESAEAHQLFFLQECMDGGSLQQVVIRAMTQQGKSYSNADALRWALEVAQALDYLHTRRPKVMHRDLKLENVLLTSTKLSEADAKLADFGLARMVTKRKMGVSLSMQRMEQAMAEAQSGELSRKLSNWTSRKLSSKDAELMLAQELTAHTGSLGYMAPEVLLGKTYDEKADVFSYGIILYNLFSRNIPTLHIVLNGTFEDLEAYAFTVAQGFRPPLESSVPKEVAALIERCWKGLPELRPSMSEVVATLEPLQQAAAASGVDGKANGGSINGQSSGKACCSIM